MIFLTRYNKRHILKIWNFKFDEVQFCFWKISPMMCLTDILKFDDNFNKNLFIKYYSMKLCYELWIIELFGNFFPCFYQYYQSNSSNTINYMICPTILNFPNFPVYVTLSPILTYNDLLKYVLLNYQLFNFFLSSWEQLNTSKAF